MRQLAAAQDALFWLDRDGDRNHLMAIPIGNKAQKPTRVAADIRGFELSADGKKLLIRKQDQLYVVDAKPAGANLGERKVDLSSWSFAIDVRRGLAADIRRRLAAAPRLLLRSGHARRQLAGRPPEIRAACGTSDLPQRA